MCFSFRLSSNVEAETQWEDGVERESYYEITLIVKARWSSKLGTYEYLARYKGYSSKHDE
jgi:hypothetical protein